METQTTANIIAIVAIGISIAQFIFTVCYFEPKKSRLEKDKNLLKNVMNWFKDFLEYNGIKLKEWEGKSKKKFFKETRKYRDENTYFQSKMFELVKVNLAHPKNKEIEEVLRDVSKIRTSLINFRRNLKKSLNEPITQLDIKKFEKMEKKLRAIFDKYIKKENKQ